MRIEFTSGPEPSPMLKIVVDSKNYKHWIVVLICIIGLIIV